MTVSETQGDFMNPALIHRLEATQLKEPVTHDSTPIEMRVYLAS